MVPAGNPNTSLRTESSTGLVGVRGGGSQQGQESHLIHSRANFPYPCKRGQVPLLLTSCRRDWGGLYSPAYFRRECAVVALSGLCSV